MADLRDAGIPVFLIRGNHDAQNRMTRDLRLPDNVTSLDVDRPQTCYHRRRAASPSTARGSPRQSVTDDLAARYPAADPGCFNVGMLHTSATGREGHDRYAPCTVEALRAKGYGYWALGHVHTREVLDDRDAPIVFPGNVQGRHIREPGAKGCMLVDRRGAPRRRPRVPPARRPPVGDLPGRRLGRDRRRRRPPSLPGRACPASSTAPTTGRWPSGSRSSGRRRRTTSSPPTRTDWAYEIRSQAQHPTARAGSGSRRSSSGPGPSGSAATAPGDGPLGELDRLLAELRGDDRLLEEFAGRELADLRKKIPPELRRDDGVDLDAPDWLRGVLDQVRPLLADRFEAVGAGPMRFLRLDLRAFGPFADAPPIDLAGGDRGLHLIHGPNEAGKSTALRAIRCLLFGFPHQTGDDHLHKYDKLRVAATSGARTGRNWRSSAVRRTSSRSGRSTTRGRSPPTPSSRSSAGSTEEKFDDLFAMDHAELVAGGRAILEGGGRLGRDAVRRRLGPGPGGRGPQGGSTRRSTSCSSPAARTRRSTRRWPS